MNNAKSVLASCRVWVAARGRAAAWMGLSMLSVSVAASDDAPVFHVSPTGADTAPGTREQPFATLGRAVAAARARPDSALRRIRLGAGAYWNVGLVLGPDDSGLVIEAAPGEQATLYGGQRLTGWAPEGERWYAATLPPLPVSAEDVKAGLALPDWEARVLLVDGRSRPRARFPETGELPHQSRFEVRWMSSTGGGWERPPTRGELTTLHYRPGDLPAGLELRNAEVTVFHMWDESCVGVAAHDAEHGQLTLASEPGHPPGAFGVRKMVVWNTREGLTRPGQWYHDRVRNRIVYWPLPGEKMDELDVVVPTRTILVRLAGAAGRPVKNVTLRGLRLSATTVPLKAGGFAAGHFDGAITLQGTEDCSFENLTVQGVAGHAIRTRGKNVRTRVVNSEITDCGAGGLYVGGEGAVIQNNRVHGIGLAYPSAIGIHQGGRDSQVIHNEVFDCPYSAINYGGTSNRIEHNLLYDCMKVLHDGAAIYLFAATNCVVRGNVVRDVKDTGGYGASAYYLDERSTGCAIEGNLSLRVNRPLHQHMANNNRVSDNVFLVEGDAQLTFPRCEGYTMERNILHATGNIRIDNPQAVSHWSKNLFHSGTGQFTGVRLEAGGYGAVGSEPLQAGDTVLADPRFRDREKGDYGFLEDSPAPAMGIRPLDLRAAVVVSHTAWAAASGRTREAFDRGWRFARYGLQADGTRRAEPGGEQWTIRAWASTEETGPGRNRPAPLAIDGNPATRWCASDAAPAQWLALDLHESRALGEMRIEWDITTAWTAAALPYGFVVEGGADGIHWTLLSDHRDPQEGNPVVVKLTGSHRHLRIRTTSVGNTQWASIREIILIDADGQVIERERLPPTPGPEAVDFDDSGWRALDLPHDWGVEGPFRLDLAGETGKLPWKGIGWYRKHFTLPAGDQGRQVFVDFDGAMAYARIWCNGEYVGTWPYGYSSFRMDLTPHVKFGGENVIAVRLDTEQWDSRWYPGAGIYRHVWLVRTNPVHVGHWGTYITTPEISDEAATVKLAVTLDNRTVAPAKATVHTSIYELGENGLPVKIPVATMTEVETDVAAHGSATVAQQTSVTHPKRWDIDAPNRYLACTEVHVDGRLVDHYDTPFGIRTIEFTARNGFLLNGRRVPIQGVCMHHDLGALGSALHDRALERQLQILIEMGCNAVRTSHNPPAPELLALADRLGLLVMDEAFDTWHTPKKGHDYGYLFDEWHERDLVALVRRDRNHPSVFMWSIGNEVMDQRNVELTRRLADIVRREDPTRPVSNGYNDPNGGRGSGAAQALDVMGVNYFFNEQDQWDKDPRYRNMPTMGSETSSCVSSRGEYFFGTHQADWQVSSYDLERPGWGCDPDTQFRVNARWPHLLGEFVWTGFDYLGEPVPYNSQDQSILLNFRNDPSKRAELEAEIAELARRTPPSRSSYFGIIDLAGFPKDRYYLYQSQWRPELPMAHLLPHWNWPERVGQPTPVHLYTSGDEAELFLNGQSLGRRKKKPGQDFRLVWNDVKYEPGTLLAVAYKNGEEWARDTVKTTGAAARLDLTVDRPAIRGDGLDLAFVTVRIADAEGLTVPRSDNLVTFTVSGPGEIVAVDNGDATSFDPFQSNRRKAFNGLALVILRAQPGRHGMINLTAESEGLQSARVTVAAHAERTDEKRD